MSLRQASEKAARGAERGYSRPPGRQTATERAVASLPDETMLEPAIDDEERSAFLARVTGLRLTSLKPSEMRWLLRTVWADDEHVPLASEALSTGLSAGRRTFDQSIIGGYLSHFPVAHPAFGQLAAAVRVAAERHDWPWRERGRRWSLWEPLEGPARLGGAMLEGDQASALQRLMDAGFDSASVDAAFVQACFEAACRQAATAEGAAAERQGFCLIGLMDTVGAKSALPAVLVYALLRPWRRASPSEAHRGAVSRLLVTRIGDPRLDRSRWDRVRANLQELGLGAEAEDALAVLRRWVVRAAMREFFEIVAKTTNDPYQWAQRTKFWLAYVDAGAIDDAWMAFGPRAEQKARGLTDRDATIRHGRISTGGGAESSHSSVIISMGDLRIAEWSHNGACRFWQASDPRAPMQYQKQYDSGRLKAMTGGQGFRHISHTSNWEPRFARHIHAVTGIPHPLHGRGGW